MSFTECPLLITACKKFLQKRITIQNAALIYALLSALPQTTTLYVLCLLPIQTYLLTYTNAFVWIHFVCIAITTILDTMYIWKDCTVHIIYIFLHVTYIYNITTKEYLHYCS
uniref:PE11R n=1 Tax=African swine fever virus TaxID=10497 RepID=A0A6G7KUC5_ASF